MPNSMADAADALCGGDEEVRAEVINGGGIRSPDEGGDGCESNGDSESTAGFNGGEEGRLPARVEALGDRHQTEYNYIGSSSDAVFPKRRCEDGEFANLGPDTKDTELRLGLPDSQDDVSGSRGGNKAAVRVPDPAYCDGISQGGRIQKLLSRNELNAPVPRGAYSIKGQEYASKEEFKLKPMFREFTTLDLPFDVRFSLPRPPLENNNARASSSGAKRIFSETLEAGRASASGESKPPAALSSQLYLPPPLPASAFNFPFAGRPTAWPMKWEPQQKSKTSYGQFSGHMTPNEVKRDEAALTVKSAHADQKGSAVESQPSQNQAGTSSEQRAAPVVGWPPVRSFRRNLASQPKVAAAAQPNAAPAPAGPTPVAAPVEKKPVTMFVKVNAEGVPIGRKIDLKAYDSYDKLAVALDDMFRNSIRVQNLSSFSANPPFSLIGGEYELVYEDDEGDRMLVGDVPWGMFVATVKRLRIIKSSEARGLAKRESVLKTSSGAS